jgi:oxygen-dependent protoporphyrinogen oxidase
MERRHRSIIRAMWKEQKTPSRNQPSGSGARWSLFVAPAGGLQELVDAIAKRLPEGFVRLDSPVTHLGRDEDCQLWRLTLPSGEAITASAVILATPAFRTSKILSEVAPDAAVELKKIDYASTATVTLAYRMQDIPHVLDAFGFVVPAAEKHKIMACTFSSLKYAGRAPEGHLLLRAFVGGSLNPELFQDDDTTMETNARNELASLLGITAQPLFSRVWRHPKSMPQYHVGHEQRIKRVESALAKFRTLAVAGSAYHGVGIPDCVRSGEEAAENLIHQL